MVRRWWGAFAYGLIVACSGGGSSDASFVPPVTDAGMPRGPGGLIVENRTDDAVVLQIRIAEELQIDRRVLLGDLSVPIAPAAFIAATPAVVRPSSSMTLTNSIGVLDSQANGTSGGKRAVGAIIGFEDGRSTLAIGDGIVFVRRSEDGSFVFEPQDPRVVTLVPVELDVTSCGDADLGTRIDGLPSKSSELGAGSKVTAVSRDASGCRVFELTDSVTNGPASVRACLPDEAFPFADGDALTVSPAYDVLSPAVRIRNAAGASLVLAHFGLEPGVEATTSTMKMLVDVDTRTKCATVAQACGDVVVPLLTELRFGSSVVSRPALRTAIADPDDANRTHFVLGAFARPVALVTCADRPDEEPFFAADLFVATVER